VNRLPETNGRCPRGDQARHGTAMIVAIVALMLISTICFSLVRWALAAQQQAERQHWQLQSMWLAESALSHAATRLRSDPNYPGDEWRTADLTDVPTASRVDVRVDADPQDDQRRIITVTADVPDDPTDRVRTQRTMTYRLPPSDSDSTD